MFTKSLILTCETTFGVRYRLLTSYARQRLRNARITLNMQKASGAKLCFAITYSFAIFANIVLISWDLLGSRYSISRVANLSLHAASRAYSKDIKLVTGTEIQTPLVIVFIVFTQAKSYIVKARQTFRGN